jgi:hypothetical protein
VQKSTCASGQNWRKHRDQIVAFAIIPASFALSFGFVHDRLSGEGGITAAPMHPTIAPHQIDVLKSNWMRRLAASGSRTGLIARDSTLMPAA